MATQSNVPQLNQQSKLAVSQEQKLCLESVYAFLQGSTIYLRAVEHVVLPEDEAQLKALLDLGSLGLSRLPEYFPEVRPLVRGGV